MIKRSFKCFHCVKCAAILCVVALVSLPAFAQDQNTRANDSPSVIDIETFTGLLTVRSTNRFEETLSRIADNWDPTYTPMLLEVGRFLRVPLRAKITSLLQEKTGQKFGVDSTAWWKWHWKQQLESHVDYADFKAQLYRRIDSSFAKYFEEAAFSEIRLDEIVWGGVQRDGIPPLKNPAMLSAKEATYLADSDVVFGIELNGEARCYPKRVLAWHEMFKDSIGGESVCGVY